MKRYRSIIKEAKIELKEGNRKSDIGSGYADIYRNHIDSLAAFRKENEVYVAKDEEDAIKKSLEGKATVLVTNAYKDTLRAYPVIAGELKLGGMFSGSFIYSSNNIVMKGYSHPIRLMDRFE